jgi:hypothetical protein
MAVNLSLRCSYSVTLTSFFACLLQHTALASLPNGLI